MNAIRMRSARKLMPSDYSYYQGKFYYVSRNLQIAFSNYYRELTCPPHKVCFGRREFAVTVMPLIFQRSQLAKKCGRTFQSCHILIFQFIFQIIFYLLPTLRTYRNMEL
jgi:hypothetical protein